MASLKGFPNSFCQDNNTGNATVEGVRSGGCRCPHWNGPYSNYLAKRCMMISILVIMSWSCMSLSWSASEVVLLLNRAPVLTTSLQALCQVWVKRYLKLLKHTLRSHTRLLCKKILGTSYCHICFLNEGLSKHHWEIPQVEFILPYGEKIGSFIFQEFFQPYFMWFCRSSGSFEWYSYGTYVLLAAIGTCFSRTDKTPCGRQN